MTTAAKTVTAATERIATTAVRVLSEPPPLELELGASSSPLSCSRTSTIPSSASLLSKAWSLSKIDSTSAGTRAAACTASAPNAVKVRIATEHVVAAGELVAGEQESVHGSAKEDDVSIKPDGRNS
jgi:hypothetical protein